MSFLRLFLLSVFFHYNILVFVLFYFISSYYYPLVPACFLMRNRKIVDLDGSGWGGIEKSRGQKKIFSIIGKKERGKKKYSILYTFFFRKEMN